ncbi:nuclear pore complex protein Nup153 [Adelges cooleyi]|uniref:nuclear pore complex protein Nup153 n=1 Tax=Adelges cooleyi TaxID=133065 RepID=UPI00217F4CB0|nr:nuclear pore complex protein Nup153 [Adelges cooleyi]XP_050422625.1 nuclear pore complex protein Nup153 [Adelges cooleyi]XP_050422626.1 nuclear pore complex protein Nup153 [Adelges cooleyi]
MKPYDKSNSFMRRVTKRVSELIPGTTWMNKLMSDPLSDNDPSPSETDDQPPVKKLCTPNNTFMKYTNRSGCSPSVSLITPDNHRNSTTVNVQIPEMSAVTCIPSTSRQCSSLVNQSSPSILRDDTDSRGTLKRKVDEAELSNINRQSSKGMAFNFASSTPAVVSTSKSLNPTLNLKKSYNLNRTSLNSDFSTPTKLNSKSNDSSSALKFGDTSKHAMSSPSFRWDTFVNYGELSERQKLFAQKSPLNCSQVMYGGGSARSNLSKILGNTPPIHRKTVIPISPATNNEIRTTSSILLQHISTKNKAIEENKFIIQPKVNIRHKAEQKSIPIRVETTVRIVDTPEKTECSQNSVQQQSTGHDMTRKLRANILKKSRGTNLDELEMPTKVDLPNISLPVSALPIINLATNNDVDNEFSFNQPLTIEQFSKQVVEKTSKRKHKSLEITANKKPDIHINTDLGNNTKQSFKAFSPPAKKPSTQQVVASKVVDNSTKKVDTVANVIKVNSSFEPLTFNDVLRNPSHSSSNFQLGTSNGLVFGNTSTVQESDKKKEATTLVKTSENKKWSCDTCWVSNDSVNNACVACQTPKAGGAVQKPLQVNKPSTWTCETCWVPNKSENDACVACQTSKPGVTKKIVQESATWKCDACWVVNKSDCTSCVSCGTSKPGSKPKPTAQFNFGLNNNTSDKSSSSSSNQFKFGFDSSKNDQPAAQLKLVPDNSKNDQPAAAAQFKFGADNSKTGQPATQFKFDATENGEKPTSGFKFGVNSTTPDSSSFGAFKFGTTTPSVNNTNCVPDNKTTAADPSPSSTFTFGLNNKLDQPENKLNFGFKNQQTPSLPITQFKFGPGSIESDKLNTHEKVASENSNAEKCTNESMKLTNNKSDFSTKTEDTKININNLSKSKEEKSQCEKAPQFTFGSTNTNCINSINNSVAQFGEHKKEESNGTFTWNKNNDITESKQIDFGNSATNKQSSPSINMKKSQMVNGHSQPKEIASEDNSGFIKSPQLFSFGSIAKQEQTAPGEQKKQSFSFGSSNSDNFNSPNLNTNKFSVPLFGASNQSNTVFGNATTTSAAIAPVMPPISVPSFNFGSVPPSNSFFSKPVNDNNTPFTQTPNPLASATNNVFSFSAPSQPVFSSTNNSDALAKPVQLDDQMKTSSNLFSQASAKPALKLDPNAPISINFTGGATTQFTAQPSETSEPPTKRKILKPVRRIR